MTTALFRRLLVPALTLLGAGIVPLAAQEAQPRPDPRYVAKARADSARYPYTEADVHFMQGMINHHSGAVGMVNELLGTYGAAQDEITAKLAQDIQIDQTTEITRMQKMLAASLGLTGPA